MPLSAGDTITLFAFSSSNFAIATAGGDYYEIDTVPSPLNQVTTRMYDWPASEAATRDLVLQKYNAGEIPGSGIVLWGRRNPTPETIAELELEGRNNPLDPTSIPRILRRNNISISLGQDTTYTADTTGKKTVEFQGDWRVATREAASDTVTIGQDLTVTRYGSIYQITIDFEYDGAIGPTDTSTIEGLDYVRAFVAIMNGVTSDTDVDGGAEVADWTGRTFTLGPYTGETETTTTVTVTDVSLANVSLGQVYFFLTASAGNMDRNVIETWFRAQGVSLSTVMQLPEYGGPISIAYVSEARLPSGNILREDRRQLVLRGANGLNIPLGVNAGRVPEVRTFPQVSGSTDYAISFTPYTHGTYLGSDATVAVTARLPRPSDAHINNDVARMYRVANKSPNTFHIHDWDGNALVALQPSRDMEVEYSLDSLGVGQLRVTRVRPRLYFEENDSRTWSFSSGGSVTIGTNTWYLVDPGSEHVVRDADAFAERAGTNPHFSWRGIGVLQDGEIDLAWYYDLTIASTASGSSHLYTRLIRARNNVISIIGVPDVRSSVSLADSPLIRVGLAERIQAEAGDWYALGARLASDTTSFSAVTHLTHTNVYCRFELYPDILVTES